MRFPSLPILLILALLVLAGGLSAQLLREAEPQLPQRALPSKEVFKGFLAGGYLMPLRLSYQSASAKDIEGLSSASLSLLRLGISTIDQSRENMPIFHGYLGLMDNVGASYGSIRDQQFASYYGDIVSLYAGPVYPLMDYKAYLGWGAKLSGFVQGPIQNEYEFGGVKYRYVYKFEGANGDRSISETTPITPAFELGAHAGFRVYQEVFLTAGLGMRYNQAPDGNWYLKSDVDQWLDGTWTNPWEPDPWISDPVFLPLPSRNVFYEDLTAQFSISLGTNF